MGLVELRIACVCVIALESFSGVTAEGIRGKEKIATTVLNKGDTDRLLEQGQQESSTWVCTAFDRQSPWLAYAKLRNYLKHGNKEKRDLTDENTAPPVMEVYRNKQSQLCVYLQRHDHCYPPSPDSEAVKPVKQLRPRKYYFIYFWGYAGNNRLEFYRNNLRRLILKGNKVANLDLFHVSYFPDNAREVRYDAADGIRTAADAVKPSPKQGAQTKFTDKLLAQKTAKNDMKMKNEMTNQKNKA